MTRIIVAAPYPTIRAGLRTALAEDPGFSVIAEASDVDALMTLLDEQLPDVLLLDVVDDPAEWLTALNALATENVLPPVILMVAAPADALDGLQIPNASILLRDASLDEITATVRSASIGLVTFDPQIVGEINEQLGWQRAVGPVEELLPLTPRELQVLHGIAHGWPNKTIAVELGISEHTVKFHVSSIFEKLGVASRSEAIAVAARRGLFVL